MGKTVTLEISESALAQFRTLAALKGTRLEEEVAAWIERYVKTPFAAPGMPGLSQALDAKVRDGDAPEPEKTTWPCQAGTAKESILFIAPDFDAPLDEFREYVE